MPPLPYAPFPNPQVYYHHWNRTGYQIVTSTKTYGRDMARSTFCLAPTGGGHGKRNVLVTMMGCVPVTVTDGVYQPFEPEVGVGKVEGSWEKVGRGGVLKVGGIS